MDFFGFTFVMFIGAAVALLGFLMLLLTAFTTSAAWGLGSLVVPPVTIAFAVAHWGKAKNGFAILMIGAIIFAYGNWDKSRVPDKPATVAVDSSAPTASAPDASTAPAPATTSAPDNTATPTTPVPQSASTSAPAPKALQQQSGGDDTKPQLINIIDVHKYMNSEVRITTDDGVARTGTLIDENDQGLAIDSVVDGATGRVRLTIPEDKIHLIELLPQ